MNAATKRAILRWIHLIVAIPILGYVYGPAAEVEQYASAARFVFVPVLIVSGYWMYSGAYFAVLGVAVWLAAIHLSGSGAAILSQAALFIARKAWLMIRARCSKPAAARAGSSSTLAAPSRSESPSSPRGENASRETNRT